MAYKKQKQTRHPSLDMTSLHVSAYNGAILEKNEPVKYENWVALSILITTEIKDAGEYLTTWVQPAQLDTEQRLPGKQSEETLNT